MKKAFQLETAKNLNHDCKLNGFRRFSYPKEAGLALGGPGFSPFVMLEVFFSLLFSVQCLSLPSLPLFCQRFLLTVFGQPATTGSLQQPRVKKWRC